MKKGNFHENYDRTENHVIDSDRKFGFIFSIIFFCIFTLPFFKKGTLLIWPLIAAVSFLIISIFKHKWLRPLNMAWMWLGRTLGLIVSPIILFILFYGVFLPIGAMLKIFNKDILSLKFNSENKTYWIDSATQVTTMKDQF